MEKDGGVTGEVGGEGLRQMLIAVEDSESSRRAVLYVADFLGGIPRFRVTLFHVLTIPPVEYFDEGTERNEWVRLRKEEIGKLLERYRQVLIDGGFPGEWVETAQYECESEAVADVVLRQHEAIGACTVVVGRRSRSRQEEFLFGSVSSSIVKRAKGCSVWVVK